MVILILNVRSFGSDTSVSNALTRMTAILNSMSRRQVYCFTFCRIT
jgi:hypothetical protein